MVATLLSIFSLFNRNMADPRAERTFLAVKPDGVQRGLVGEIISRFEKRGYKLGSRQIRLVVEPVKILIFFLQPSKDLLHNHYAELSSKPFFPGLIEYMSSGPVFAMVWEGTDVVSVGRKMLGATNPRESPIGTIRGDFAIDVGRNICHGSDSVGTAEREIALWFTPDEVVSYGLAQKKWIYE
ncbi:unnamed protein product [Candidula unifasciata]|uniref:Nucleoside diphosphate kinase n=1 Tax=Candidula unifasciata TaxID=100452 RepID=A0A8S3ZQR8_9EUPU|nr:unnamed protein product [Candidula unifasciata]